MARIAHIKILFLAFFTLASVGPVAAQYATPTIVLDYTYDTNNFFGAAGSPQRLALQQAATTLTSRLSDTLTAITPGPIAGGGMNTWTAVFDNPGTGVEVNLSNLSLVQNEIRVFAGGSNLSGTTLGVGGPGGFGASGTQAFLDNLTSRGQAGALLATPTDFGPWGGAITFDTTGTVWNFNLAGPVAGQSDFLSVAEHELGHLLGIGTADSWYGHIAGTTFTGATVRAYNGNVNPSVTADGGHFASGTGGAQEAAMTPSILVGTRKEFTTLDYAGLADIGWEVSPIPEPSSVLAIAGIAFLAMRRRLTSRVASAPGEVCFSGR